MTSLAGATGPAGAVGPVAEVVFVPAVAPELGSPLFPAVR